MRKIRQALLKIFILIVVLTSLTFSNTGLLQKVEAATGDPIDLTSNFTLKVDTNPWLLDGSQYKVMLYPGSSAKIVFSVKTISGMGYDRTSTILDSDHGGRYQIYDTPSSSTPFFETTSDSYFYGEHGLVPGSWVSFTYVIPSVVSGQSSVGKVFASNYSGSTNKLAFKGIAYFYMNSGGTNNSAGFTMTANSPVIIDGNWFNHPPSISLTSPVNNRILSEVPGYNKLTISGTVKDQNVGDTLAIKYQMNSAAAKSIQTITATGANQPITNYDILIDASISEGAHVLKVWVEDDKGGISSIETRSFIVDKTPPAQPVLLEDPPGKAPSKQITITYSGDSAVKEYQIGTGAWTAYTGPFTIKQNGTITARATDAAGNKSTKSIVITNINPPDPIVTVSNITNTGFTVTDTGTYTDPVEYQFDLYVEGSATLIATYPSASTWQEGKTYTFTDLNPNVNYKAVVRVRFK